MWSFVAQNFCNNPTSKTRRSIAMRKLYWSDFYSPLIKYNTTRFDLSLNKQVSTYYWLYKYLFKNSFWSVFCKFTYKNQGVIYNNLTISYYYTSIIRLSFWLAKPDKRIVHDNVTPYLNTYSSLSLPFIKTTFNSLVYLSYHLLISYYTVHPMWFKLLHTYTWLTNSFLFDIALNTFYFKIYKY